MWFDGKRVSRKWHRVLTRARAEGVRFHLNSGRRTLAEQWVLYRQNMSNGRPRPGHPLTAYPNPNAPHIRTGRSNHALDINSIDGGETRLQQWLQRKGTHPTNPVFGEAWHLELNNYELRWLYRKLR